MEDVIVQYSVEYFYDSELLKTREPTRVLPRKDDLVVFPVDGDAYISEVYRVEDVCILVPESDAELVRVQITLETHE